VGPYVSTDLKAGFSSSRVATQGVNYAASLGTNFLPGGADPNGVQNMAALFQQVYNQCPNSVIVAGGYSQGAAVTHEAISNSGLSSSVISKIVGVVLFGDTQYLQDGGRITNYPTQNTLIICAPGDLVCDGTLVITAAHLSYGANAQQAANFLKSRINAAGVS
jgi:cutinase